MEINKINEVVEYPLDKIILKKIRVREEIGDLTPLKDSIRALGVRQPITLNKNGELISGLRRYTACKELGMKSIPAIICEFNDEVFELEWELDENLCRKQLDWIEEAIGITRLHKLKQKKYGVKEGASKGWSAEDTSRLLKVSKTRISKAKAVVENLHRKEIAQSKSLDEAYNKVLLLKQREAVTVLEEKIKERIKECEKQGAEFVDKTYLNMSAQQLLPKIKDESIDFVYCDPPYGINLDTEVLKSTSILAYKDRPEDLVDLLEYLAAELYRVLKPSTFCVIWHAYMEANKVVEIFGKAGFAHSQTPIIWGKIAQNVRCSRPELNFASGAEFATLFRKGPKPHLTKQGRLNLFLYKPLPAQHKVHECHKPTELNAEIIKYCSNPLSIVLDPCAGSGSTVASCASIQRFPITCEILKDKYLSGRKWLISEVTKYDIPPEWKEKINSIWR